MTAHFLAQAGYGRASQPVKTPRASEYEAVARITRELQRANSTRQTDFPTFVTAVQANRRLWSAFALDLASEENALPLSLRAQLLSLASFTFKTSAQAIADTSSVQPLIDINLSVMRGLKGGALAA